MPKQRITLNTLPEIKKLKHGYSVRFRLPPHDDKPWGYSKTKKYPDAKSIGEISRLAEEYREELEDEINDYTVKGNITFGEYARRWHDDRKDTGELLPYSWDREELHIKKIEKSNLAKIPLIELTEEDIDEFKKANKKESKSEQARLLNKVKQILKFAESRRRIKYDPSRNIKNVKEEPQQRRSLTKKQQAKLFNILFGTEPGKTNYSDIENMDGKHAAIVIALATGLRLGEVLGLIWEDVDPDKQTISVKRQLGRNKEIKPPKYNSVGIIPLDRYTLGYLAAWRQKTKELTGRTGKKLDKTPICCNEHYEYYLPTNYSRWFRQFMTDNGLAKQNITRIKDSKGMPRKKRTEYNGPRFHELRHTVATELLGSGADLQTVKTIMRHSRITTTEQYIHDIPENLAAAIEKTAQERSKAAMTAFDDNKAKARKRKVKWD